MLKKLTIFTMVLSLFVGSLRSEEPNAPEAKAEQPSADENANAYFGNDAASYMSMILPIAALTVAAILIATTNRHHHHRSHCSSSSSHSSSRSHHHHSHCSNCCNR